MSISKLLAKCQVLAHSQLIVGYVKMSSANNFTTAGPHEIISINICFCSLDKNSSRTIIANHVGIFAEICVAIGKFSRYKILEDT